MLPRSILLAALLFPACIGYGGPDTEPAASTRMSYVYNAAQSPVTNGIRYPWQILHAALERTEAEYGAFALTEGPRMSETRRIDELRRATGVITVMHYDANAGLERDLIPIRIPVDRNMAGYRVFLVRRERVAAFAQVTTLADLKAFSFGLGFDWSDVGVLRSADLNVVTGSSYEGLFDMVDNGRFDILLGAASSALDEIDDHREQLPDLVIEPGLILYYPMPMYFWFSRTPEGERLAARAEEGMRAMIADGTFERLFNDHYGPVIGRLNLTQRRILRIENPNLPADTPLGDKQLWFDPATYRPPGNP